MQTENNELYLIYFGGDKHTQSYQINAGNNNRY